MCNDKGSTAKRFSYHEESVLTRYPNSYESLYLYPNERVVGSRYDSNLKLWTLLIERSSEETDNKNKS